MAKWWDEWELHILVVASTCAQYFLVLLAGVRKFHIPPWLRFSFRLAHIGSDALALFALATLASRQKSGPGCTYAPGGRDMELLCAPILVMHLGGQVAITTYKIEDNEQWSRHILTSLSKVTVALYVFYKTWSSKDQTLLAATVLLFIVVIIRCFKKGLALKDSSFNALRKANSYEVEVVRGSTIREDEQLNQLFHFIEQTKEIMDSDGPLQILYIRSLPCDLFLDFPCSNSVRLNILRIFYSLERESGYRAIENTLSKMTSFLYTKEFTSVGLVYPAFKNGPGLVNLCKNLLSMLILVAAFFLVAFSGLKQRYGGKDYDLTFGLLFATVMLETIHQFVRDSFREKFCGRILQHNIIELFANNRRRSTLRSIAGWLLGKDLLEEYFWHMEPSNSCHEITELVRLHVETGWKEHIRDVYSYRMFNDTRGEWTLARNRCLRQLGWSLKRPFDESIVLWHLATDLYIHHTCTSPDDHLSARWCKVMSNYMVHLLCDNPDMLMPGSRKKLLETAYEELEVLLEGETTPMNEKELTQRVFEKCKSSASLSQQDTSSLVGDAWELAQSLLSVDDTKIWKLIQGVWVEMLCFSASRCRGYLHAEALGTGVEFLSYVSILLACTGMETFPEKLQRRECYTFDSDESLGFGFARERGDAVTPFARSGVETLPEELQRREGHSFDSEQSLDPDSARERRDAVTPPAAQSEGAVDIVLEP